MKTSDTLKEIAPALVAFQAEVKDPRKDSDNPYFKSKYVELDGLMMAVDRWPISTACSSVRMSPRK